ncbi:IclR family transcriptional regulator domain-containing protein [Bradyrhizobium sp. USDA 4516]
MRQNSDSLFRRNRLRPIQRLHRQRKFGDDQRRSAQSRLACANDRAWVGQQLADTRQRGYATCVGEIDEGLAAIAVPVKLSSGMVLRSVAMTGPLQRIMNDQLADRLRALRGTADTLAVSLSIRGQLKRKSRSAAAEKPDQVSRRYAP